MNSVDFAIAGGGVAGLTAALALGREGSSVAVFERRAGRDDLGAGLQLSPNATRVARELGILGSLEARATEPRRLRIRRGRDGATIASLPLGEAVRRRHGAPSLLLHRADLLEILGNAVAACAGVTLRHGIAIDGFDGAGRAVTAIGPDGPERIGAGGLVRADGLWSRGRPRVPVRPSGRTAWRTLIQSDALPSALAEPETTLWLGQDAHVVHYPLRGGALVNVVVILVETAEGKPDGTDPWALPGDPALLRRRLARWHRDVTLLTEAPAAWRRWPLFDGGPGPRWSEGPETRIGDAAHPMLPFLAQGASQGFEDAAALAAAARAMRDPAAAFARFEAMRRARAERVVAASRRQGRIYHLGGPAALARDLAMRALGPERLLAGMDWLWARAAN